MKQAGLEEQKHLIVKDDFWIKENQSFEYEQFHFDCDCVILVLQKYSTMENLLKITVYCTCAVLQYMTTA